MYALKLWKRVKQKIISDDIPNELCKYTCIKKSGYHLLYVYSSILLYSFKPPCSKSEMFSS